MAFPSVRDHSVALQWSGIATGILLFVLSPLAGRLGLPPAMRGLLAHIGLGAFVGGSIWAYKYEQMTLANPAP